MNNFNFKKSFLSIYYKFGIHNIPLLARAILPGFNEFLKFTFLSKYGNNYICVSVTVLVAIFYTNFNKFYFME